MIAGLLAIAPNMAWSQAPPTAPSPQIPSDPDARLKLARDAFSRGELHRLRPLLLPVLDPTPQLDTLDARMEARSMLGFGLFFEAQSVTDSEQRKQLIGLARGQFLELMRERPDHILDAGVYPASVVEVFEEVRRENKEELDERRKELTTPKTDTQIKLETIYIERVVRRRSWALNFAPFGLGQFQNGDTGLGIAVAATQALALGANLTSAVAVEYLRQGTQTGRFPTDGTFQLAQSWQAAQLVSAGVLFMLYGGGVAHSLWRYEEVEVERIKTLDRPPPELAPKPRGGVVVSPWGVGWGATF